MKAKEFLRQKEVQQAVNAALPPLAGQHVLHEQLTADGYTIGELTSNSLDITPNGLHRQSALGGVTKLTGWPWFVLFFMLTLRMVFGQASVTMAWDYPTNTFGTNLTFNIWVSGDLKNWALLSSGIANVTTNTTQTQVVTLATNTLPIAITCDAQVFSGLTTNTNAYGKITVITNFLHSYFANAVLWPGSLPPPFLHTATNPVNLTFGPHVTGTGGSSSMFGLTGILTSPFLPYATGSNSLANSIVSQSSTNEIDINGVPAILTLKGFDNGPGNYQRLAIYSTGTNGANVFDSQSSGTAGAVRPLAVFYNGTNRFEIAGSTNAGVATTIYDPLSHTITVDNTGGKTTIQSADDNVFFGSGGTISLQASAASGNTFSGRRIELRQTTPADSGTQQPSQSLLWVGRGWSTNQAADEQVEFAAISSPAAGGAHASGTWLLESTIGNTAAVTNFAVSSASGYGGSGTHFLSDDGTYKTGDTIWTNSAGTITLTANGQVTNYFLFTSGDTTGAATGFVIVDDGAGDITTRRSNAGILTLVSRAGTTNATFGDNGSMLLGDAEAFFANDPGNVLLWSGANGLSVYSQTTNFTTFQQLLIAPDATTLNWTKNGGAANGFLSFQPFNAIANPNFAFGAPVTGGGNIAEILNGNTNVFTIAYNGAFAAGQTNQWTTGPVGQSIAVTVNATNAVPITIDGKKVYILIANETPP